MTTNIPEYPCYETDESLVQTLTYTGALTLTVPLTGLVPDDAVYSDNDEGLAKRFLDVYRFKVRYCVEEKQWYVHDGTCWKPDSANAVMLQIGRASCRERV